MNVNENVMDDPKMEKSIYEPDANLSQYEDDGGGNEEERSASSNWGGTDRASNMANISAQLTASDSKRVFWSRVAFRFILFVATVAMASAVYAISKNQDKRRFETRFKDFANQIIDVSQLNARDIFSVYEGISLQITIHTMADDVTWPNITIPGFEAQGQEATKATGATVVGVAPFVTDETREAYGAFRLDNQGWMQDDLDWAGSDRQAPPIQPKIWHTVNQTIVYPEGLGIYAPIAMSSPIERYAGFVNLDALILPNYKLAIEELNRTRTAILSKAQQLDGNISNEAEWPSSYMVAPIFDNLGDDKQLVGALTSTLPWHNYFLNLVPEGIDGIYTVVRNTCDQSFTYWVDGPTVNYLGPGNVHDPKFDYLEVSTNLTSFRSIRDCQYTFFLYPSADFQNTYTTTNPIRNTVVVVTVFVLTALAFFIYDSHIEQRQTKVLDKATRSQAIVRSLFPDNVRERMMNENGPDDNGKAKRAPGKNADAFRIWHGRDGQPLQPANDRATAPIADHYTCATVLFGDIVGFNAWSSTREPAEVFTLLEEVYNAFDKIAKRLGVFKVETIGDSYLAVCGLPEPRDDHSVIMFRFARLCLHKANSLVQTLASELGPDTADLFIRFGLHSGPVTAGVLRGEKSRFQLFGDTVNTAARIETTGAPNRIHLSQQTVNELARHGKYNWCQERSDRVMAKGKGALKTYWGVLDSEASADSGSMMRRDSHEGGPLLLAPLPKATPTDDDISHLENHVGWIAKTMERLLKKLIATRSSSTIDVSSIKRVSASAATSILDEIEEQIQFPSASKKNYCDPRDVQVDETILQEMNEYIRTIATLHNNSNAFHSFEHSGHVVAAVQTQFARMVGPHHKLNADPLIEFSCVIAALTQNVDHAGTTDAALVQTQHALADLYNCRSISAQHAVDLAWNLLMEPNFVNLRGCIYSDQQELRLFRSLFVNASMAMDDHQPSEQFDRDVPISPNRQATIVLKHLMQAATVMHTMQHWQAYKKWNERRFNELYSAYRAGNLKKDPTPEWYGDQLELFDKRVIPMATNMADSDLFGEGATEEYLQFSRANREEWREHGRETLQGYLMTYIMRLPSQ